jgi:hypothetical protein
LRVASFFFGKIKYFVKYMSAGAVVDLILNDGPTDRLKFVASDTSRGQNQGSKRATLQGNKGLSQQKRNSKHVIGNALISNALISNGSAILRYTT